jgi:cytochrome c2
VGPSLDVSARKLRYAWVKEFLANPRAAGKIYMFTPYRMPDLGLKPDEIDAVVALLAHVAGRSTTDATDAAVAISEADVPKGQLLYFLKCAECHNLGNVIPTPLAKQQGPDLIHIQKRLRFEWIPEWVKNPMAVYPGTQMVNTNLSDEEIRQIRAFLWKTSTQQEQRVSQR